MINIDEEDTNNEMEDWYKKINELRLNNAI